MVGVAAFALVLYALGQSVSGGDTGDLETAVRGAIDVNAGITALPAGVLPGHFTATDRQALREAIRTKYVQYFAGTALTNRLSNLLSWVDRVAADPAEPHLLFYRVASVDIDPWTVAGDSATVTGTYTVIDKSGWALPGGQMATNGGSYTSSFAFEMERRSGRWFVTSFTVQPQDYSPDPSMDSNLDANPAPEETKHIPDQYTPLVPPLVEPPQDH